MATLTGQTRHYGLLASDKLVSWSHLATERKEETMKNKDRKRKTIKRQKES